MGDYSSRRLRSVLCYYASLHLIWITLTCSCRLSAITLLYNRPSSRPDSIHFRDQWEHWFNLGQKAQDMEAQAARSMPVWLSWQRYWVCNLVSCELQYRFPSSRAKASSRTCAAFSSRPDVRWSSRKSRRGFASSLACVWTARPRPAARSDFIVAPSHFDAAQDSQFPRWRLCDGFATLRLNHLLRTLP